jgi:hypothetical protein
VTHTPADEARQLLTIAEAAELAALTPKAMRRRVERGRETPRSPHSIQATKLKTGLRRRRVLIPYGELERVGLVKDGKPVNGGRRPEGAPVNENGGRVPSERERLEHERDEAVDELARARRLLAEIAVASPWRRAELLRLAREQYSDISEG